MENFIDSVRAAHQAYNDRDFELAAELALSPGTTYVDHSSGQPLNGREEFADWLRGHLDIATDMQIADPMYFDGGGVVVAQFTARGTNDGGFFGFEATGKQFQFDVCETYHLNSDGSIEIVHGYMDMLGILVQLGHIEAPAG